MRRLSPRASGANAAACATTGAIPQPFPSPAPPPRRSPRPRQVRNPRTRLRHRRRGRLRNLGRRACRFAASPTEMAAATPQDSTAAASSGTCSISTASGCLVRSPNSFAPAPTSIRAIFAPAIWCSSTRSTACGRSPRMSASSSAAMNSCTRRVRPEKCGSRRLASSYWGPRFLGARQNR